MAFCKALFFWSVTAADWLALFLEACLLKHDAGSDTLTHVWIVGDMLRGDARLRYLHGLCLSCAEEFLCKFELGKTFLSISFCAMVELQWLALVYKSPVLEE